MIREQLPETLKIAIPRPVGVRICTAGLRAAVRLHIGEQMAALDGELRQHAHLAARGHRAVLILHRRATRGALSRLSTRVHNEGLDRTQPTPYEPGAAGAVRERKRKKDGKEP